MIFAFRENPQELFSLSFIQPGNQNRLILGKHAAGDGLNLGDRFTGSVNNFGGPKPAQTVKIHLGKSLGQVRQSAARLRHVRFRQGRTGDEGEVRR